MDIKRWLRRGLTAALVSATSVLSAAALSDYGPGTTAVSEAQHPGSVVWMDLLTPDVHRAAQFYSAVFGWKFELSSKGDYAYGTLNGEPVASIVKLDSAIEGAEGLWLPSIAVHDVKAAANAVYSNGGSVLEGPQDLPGAAGFAVVTGAAGRDEKHSLAVRNGV